MKYARPDGLSGAITLFNSVKNPIDDRALTLQEYLLSRRILRYGVREIKLICQNSRSTDPAIDGSVSQYVDVIQAMITRMYQRFAMVPPYPWMGIVSEYTKRNLGYPDDRMIAIAGLAETRALVHGGLYCVGHWLEEMPNSLLWRRSEFAATKPRSIRAPTWSWASLNVSITSMSHNSQRCRQLTVHECHVLPELDSTPYGNVRQGGWVRIEGLVRKARVHHTSLLSFSGERISWGDQGYYKVCHAQTILDVVDGIDGPSLNVICLQIRPFQDEQDGGPIGLILEEREDGRMERIGLFDFVPILSSDPGTSALVVRYGREWAQHCELRTLDIV